VSLAFVSTLQKEKKKNPKSTSERASLLAVIKPADKLHKPKKKTKEKTPGKHCECTRRDGNHIVSGEDSGYVCQNPNNDHT